LPFHRSWKILSEDYKVRFGDYGDVLTGLSEINFDSILVVILVLEDVIDFVNYDQKNTNLKLNAILKAVKYRGEKSSKSTIFIPISSVLYSVVDEAKLESLESRTLLDFTNSLRDMSKTYSGLFVINGSQLFSNEGKRESFDSRNWYFSRCRFSILGVSRIIHAIRKVLDRTQRSNSKVLVLDCDNTLWGGVVGEDLISGITLEEDGIGQAFQDFQKEVLRLSNRGIIICLVSKNNEEEVWEVFSHHRGMVLQKSNITCWRINWKSKANNILEISEELGLGLDSFVFWDDNPMERQEVKMHLSEVQVVNVSNNVEDWPLQLRELSYFTKFEVTIEDISKNDQYKSRSQFKSAITKSTDRRKFLDSIGMRIEPQILASDNVKRAEQLSLKTNQFNLRVQRYTGSELQQLQSSGLADIELVSLNDYFGNHGIVGMIGLTKINNESLFINIFLLSCRAIGRDLELWMMNRIKAKCRHLKISTLYAEFVKTGKNQIVESFLDNFGFTKIHKDELVKQSTINNNIDISGTLYIKQLEVDDG
jgi:FkbH-like protein